MTERQEASTGAETAARKPARTLVFGASGYIGSHLAPRLAQEGWRVRAVSRDRRVLEARGWDGVECAEADALEPASLPAVLEDVDVAYYLVHSMGSGSDFGRIDIEAARNFALAAGRAGVRRIVYLGGLVPPDADSEHIRSRQETGDVLRAGAVPVTEIRAGIIIGPGSAAFEVMRDLVLNLPIMITPRWVRAKSPPIALENLLEYLVRIAFIDEAAGGIYDAGGPEILTYDEMMRQLAKAAGKRPPWIIPVPVLTPSLSSYWLALVTVVPTSIARALIGGLKNDFHADDAALRRLVPQKLLTVRAAIEAAFEAERSHEVASRWTEGAFALRGYRHEVGYYAKKAGASAVARATPAAVWRQVTGLGGENRYYYGNWLWTLRELLDLLVGGPGFTRGRRHPQDLRLGDAIDSWTVIGIEPERRLSLRFGMKAPGAGVLEFELGPETRDQTRVTVTTYWHPRGVWGLLYWYAFAPFHKLVFRGWTRAIARRAEQDLTAPPPQAPAEQGPSGD